MKHSVLVGYANFVSHPVVSKKMLQTLVASQAAAISISSNLRKIESESESIYDKIYALVGPFSHAVMFTYCAKKRKEI